MQRTFYDMEKLEELDLKNWNMSKVRTWLEMFDYSNNIKRIYIPTSNFIGDVNNPLAGLYLTKPAWIEDINKPEYTNKWIREDFKYGPYTWEELREIWTPEMRGYWVREKTPTKYTLNFNSGTTEQINSIEVEKDTQATLPTPTVDNPGYKFLGWTKTQDGEVITDTTNIANPSETIILYAKWEKVNNITTERTPIEVTTVYQGDNTLDKGQRNEEEGQVGEKEIVTTYKVTPITGELTDPTITENVVTPMKPKIIKLGTKPTEIEKQIELPITENQTDTLVRGKEKITQGRPRI